MALLKPVERAQRGAVFLDEHVPGWHRKVKVRPLNLDDTCRCVLGQLFERRHYLSPFDAGKADLGLSERQSEVLGFDLPISARTPDWEALTEAWKDEIRARRNKGGK